VNEQAAELLKALTAAERLLRYRPRSIQELRQRLRRRGLSAEAIEATLAQRESAGLLDDRAFAQYWVEQRRLFQPRSRQRVLQELRAKGVPRETSEAALASFEDEAVALQAARRLAPRFRRRAPEASLQHLALMRRGFAPTLARSAARQALQSVEGDAR
jgi:regulatory protein